MRKAGLEPARHCWHKILSLARLPIPTLPHMIQRNNSVSTNAIIVCSHSIVNYFRNNLNNYFYSLDSLMEASS